MRLRARRWDRRFRLSILNLSDRRNRLSHLLPCARPVPKLCGLYQTGLHRVFVDVAGNLPKLVAVTHPMIPGFVFPERLTGETENFVSATGCGTLQPTRNRRQRNAGRQQQVNVIGHNHPGMQFVESALGFSCHKGIRHKTCDPGVHQPARSGGLPIQLPVAFHKRRQDLVARTRRHRSIESPGREDRSPFSIPMWEIASVVRHAFDGISGAGGENFS